MCSSGSESVHIHNVVQALIARVVYSFSAAFSKLMELGVPTSQFVTPEPWIMKNLGEKE